MTSSDDISSTTDMTRDFTPHKRHYKETNKYGEPPTKRSAPTIRLGAGFKWNLQALANAADAVESGGKSPVSALNELGVRVMYTILRQGGPAHCPSFSVAVTVADMTFEGWGHSKREARASAARACLAALLARAGRVLPAPTPHQDFTSDEPAKYPVSEFQCLETKMRPPPPVITNTKEASPVSTSSPSSLASPATALFGATNPSTALKSPINLLYENYPGLSFNCTFGDNSPLDATQAPLQLSHSMRFKVVCQIKEQKFEGYGSSKKLAKLAAARSALAVLEEGRAETPAPAAAHAGFLPQTLADHIGKLVNEKFNEVMRGDLVHSKRKVLAGIVITTNHRIEGAKVIAVTTGTKCVSGEHMSVRGRAMNDCHAEVAARRCLQRHLYAQLLMYASAADPRSPIPESDLEPVAGGGYQLKRDRQVHLYVSTAPCGDSRIFSPHEQPEPEPDRHPNRLARGQLRTKIESGEGTIPVKNCNNFVQTWDGVMQGERLLTMSCSDKVARWCVVGLQGALLSRVIKPVYLHSLVLGSLLHVHHMYRAICGRIEAYISCLPPPFQLQRPLLARAASTEARTPARAPSFSVCWCSTTPQPEIINATTGKLETGQPSLLCKQSMFARWQYAVQRLPLLQLESETGVPAPVLPKDIEHLLYNEAKQLCPTYQVAKERLFEAFEKAKLGRWIKKPLEQDQFICEITDADPQVLFAWAGPVLDYSTVQYEGRNEKVREIDEKKFEIENSNDFGQENNVINENLAIYDRNAIKINVFNVTDKETCRNYNTKAFEVTDKEKLGINSKNTLKTNIIVNLNQTNKEPYFKAERSTINSTHNFTDKEYTYSSGNFSKTYQTAVDFKRKPLESNSTIRNNVNVSESNNLQTTTVFRDTIRRHHKQESLNQDENIKYSDTNNNNSNYKRDPMSSVKHFLKDYIKMNENNDDEELGNNIKSDGITDGISTDNSDFNGNSLNSNTIKDSTSPVDNFHNLLARFKRMKVKDSDDNKTTIPENSIKKEVNVDTNINSPSYRIQKLNQLYNTIVTNSKNNLLKPKSDAQKENNVSENSVVSETQDSKIATENLDSSTTTNKLSCKSRLLARKLEIMGYGKDLT